MKRAFARLAWRDAWDESPPLEQLRWAGKKLVEWRDYDTAWLREPFAREEEVDTIVRLIHELAQLSARPRRVTDNLYKHLAPVRALAGSIERAESAGPENARRDYDALESMVLKLGRDLRDLRKGSGAYGDVERETLIAKREELMRWIGEFRRRADADLAAALREEMRGVVEEYERRKHRAGKLDFVDLLIKVRNLVRDQPEVRGVPAGSLHASVRGRISGHRPLCNRKSCFCSLRTIRGKRIGAKPLPSRENCCLLAIRSNPSTSSGEPISSSIAMCATRYGLAESDSWN